MTIPEPPNEPSLKVYDRVILRVFEKLRTRYGDNDRMPFLKEEVEQAIAELGVKVRNPPDVPYTYRTGRSALPDAILQQGNWAIDSEAGKSNYVFVKLERSPYFDIPADMEATLIPDATPQIVLQYTGTDEQALLSRIRYNRLVDIFTGLTAFHLQSHFRTTVSSSQIEIDDLYIGVNADGQGFLLPIEAKTSREKLGVTQIAAMIGFARQYYPQLPILPIGIKLLADESLMFIEFNDEQDLNRIATRRYKRYRLYRDH
jgi:hypothetical protein